MSTQAAEHETTLEVSVLPHGRLGLTAFSALLQEVRLALLEIDRHALPTPAPRVEWSVIDLRRDQELHMVLAPSRRPRGRSPMSLAMAPAGLVNGLTTLRRVPEIPSLFGPSTVERVTRMGRQVTDGTIERLRLSSLNGTSHEAVLDAAVVQSAERAVRPASHAYSSVRGLLSMLKVQSRSVRAEIRTSDRRGVSVHAGLEQLPELREKLGEQVLAGGILKRNSTGQPVTLDLLELELVPAPSNLTAWDILGSNPGITGDLSTQDYVDLIRGG